MLLILVGPICNPQIFGPHCSEFPKCWALPAAAPSESCVQGVHSLQLAPAPTLFEGFKTHPKESNTRGVCLVWISKAIFSLS